MIFLHLLMIGIVLAGVMYWFAQLLVPRYYEQLVKEWADRPFEYISAVSGDEYERKQRRVILSSKSPFQWVVRFLWLLVKLILLSYLTLILLKMLWGEEEPLSWWLYPLLLWAYYNILQCKAGELAGEKFFIWCLREVTGEVSLKSYNTLAAEIKLTELSWIEGTTSTISDAELVDDVPMSNNEKEGEV